MKDSDTVVSQMHHNIGNVCSNVCSYKRKAWRARSGNPPPLHATWMPQKNGNFDASKNVDFHATKNDSVVTMNGMGEGVAWGAREKDVTMMITMTSMITMTFVSNR
jgi:hypothetical protein